MIRLEKVKPEDRVNGEFYLCDMKHGYIEGWWDESRGVCSGYYWGDIEWHPYTTYLIVEEPDA